MLKRFCGSIIVQKFNTRALFCIAFAQVSAATEQHRQVYGWVDIALKHPLRLTIQGKPSGLEKDSVGKTIGHLFR